MSAMLGVLSIRDIPSRTSSSAPSTSIFTTSAAPSTSSSNGMTGTRRTLVTEAYRLIWEQAVDCASRASHEEILCAGNAAGGYRRYFDVGQAGGGDVVPQHRQGVRRRLYRDHTASRPCAQRRTDRVVADVRSDIDDGRAWTDATIQQPVNAQVASDHRQPFAPRAGHVNGHVREPNHLAAPGVDGRAGPVQRFDHRRQRCK